MVFGDLLKYGILIVEYIMVVFFGMGVDNFVVEIDGLEMLIMDGSSVVFVEVIEMVGLCKLDCGWCYLKVNKIVCVDIGSVWCEFYLYDCIYFDIMIYFLILVIGKQKFVLDIILDVFCEDLFWVWIFGYVKDVEQFWKMGFVLGLFLENFVVILDDKVFNFEGICWLDEFVCYKVFDVVGDLVFVGLLILGFYCFYKGGYKMNYLILVKLFEDLLNFEIVEVLVFCQVGQVGKGGLVVVVVFGFDVF